MTLATLAEVLPSAAEGGYALAGLVCLGWEDMRAYVAAAEAERAPVILQAGPGCRAHTPIPVLAAMMRALAIEATVPVVVHLDHGTGLDDCRAAIEAGFTSVMVDGSRLPFHENVALTRAVTDMAHAAGVSCEGEIGFVGYAAGAASQGTDPDEAALFARETGVDALAVSVGNVHLVEAGAVALDLDRLRAIDAATATPLVLHGGSGIGPADRARIAGTTRVAKVNIGTELRQAFGRALRATLDAEPDVFDRIAILRRTEGPVTDAARAAIRSLRP